MMLDFLRDAGAVGVFFGEGELQPEGWSFLIGGILNDTLQKRNIVRKLLA